MLDKLAELLILLIILLLVVWIVSYARIAIV